MTYKISELRDGGEFNYGNHTWTLLEQDENGGLSLSKEIIDNAAYNEDADQAWKGSSMRNTLMEELLPKLVKDGVDDKALVDMEVDLKAVDGSEAYGKDLLKIALLTEEQYANFKPLIPSVPEVYWLLTPYSCDEFYIGGAYRHFVRVVRPDGSVDGSRPDGGLYGIRPTIKLDPDTEVEAEYESTIAYVTE